MNEEETPHPETELARLQAENARLRAMIDRLERRSGDEPAPPAANTQIIRAEPEAPAPARSARSADRPKRPRTRRKREQKKPSSQGCLRFMLITGGILVTYIGLTVLGAVLSDGLRAMNFWFWLAICLLFAPVALLLVVFFISILIAILALIRDALKKIRHPHAPPLSIQSATIQSKKRPRRPCQRANQPEKADATTILPAEARPRRRVTRKLRAAITQKLVEGSSGS